MPERRFGGRSGRALAATAALGLAALIGLDARPARAFVPKPDRALAAIAQANLTSGRTQAIQLDLVMRIGDQAGLATGQLVSHPSGLARLELRGSGGRVDRYLLSGPELLAAKDGEALADPQPMLQPVFLLQPSSQETLRVALESFGVDSRFIGVAPCGELDCYVFGDPALAAPAVRRLPVGGRDGGAGAGDVEAGARGDSASDADGLDPADDFARDTAIRGGRRELEPARDPGRPIARLWADTETLQIQRIDRDSGESLQLGPIVRFERLMVPSWLEIQRPGEPAIHFDVKRAVRVNATPQAFNPSWLYSPIDPADPAAGGSAPALASPAASPVPAP
ncbi:hypothetical protein K2X89_03330 [Myxococcota bacterium]|nr:hypothetical protein [Myxococcota bacterium]